MKRNNIIIGCVGGLLLSSVAVGLYLHRDDQRRISELESQLSTLRQQEQRSAVDRRVSKQMEEIATDSRPSLRSAVRKLSASRRLPRE